jgi:hypothetical protein
MIQASDDLIETVARAICRPLCRADFHPADTDDGYTCKPEACKHWAEYKNSARAAIETLANDQAKQD